MATSDLSCNLYNIAYNYSANKVWHAKYKSYHRVDGTNPNPLITTAASPCNGPKTYKDRLLAKKQYVQNNTNSNSNKSQLTKAQILSRVARGYTPTGQTSRKYGFQSQTVTNSNIYDYPIINNQMIICPPCPPELDNWRSAYFDGSFNQPFPFVPHNFIDFSGGSTTDISFDQFTFSLWIKFTELSDLSINIITATDNQGSNIIWSNNLRVNNRTLEYCVYDSNHPDSATCIHTPDTSLNINTWYNIIVTQQNDPTPPPIAAYKSILYLNGILEASMNPLTPAQLRENRWKIGGTSAGHNILANIWRPMKGYIDQFVYYNAIMSPSDVLTFYTETLKSDTIPDLPSASLSSVALSYDFNAPNSNDPTNKKSGVLTDVSYNVSTEHRFNPPFFCK